MSNPRPRLSLNVAITLAVVLVITMIPRTFVESVSPVLTREQIYSQKGMIQNWVAPMPPTPLQAANVAGTSGSGEKFLVQNWATTFHSIQIGGNDISFTSDPFVSPTAVAGDSTKPPASSSNTTAGVASAGGDPNYPLSSQQQEQQQVLRLDYPKGSYAPSIGPIAGGTHFYANPFGDSTPFESMMVSYDVAFPSGFNWVLAGKLPGIYGGSPYDGCSGGVQSTGTNCLTMRLMWRQGGLGEVYAYVPADPKSDFCKNSAVICNDQYGKSIGRGQIYFQPGAWTRLDMIMSLNKPAGNSNGTLQVYQNGVLAIQLNNVPYRSSGMVGFQGLMFSSFFGGSDPTYATPVDTSVYFRNVQLSVGQPADLYQGTGGKSGWNIEKHLRAETSGGPLRLAYPISHEKTLVFTIFLSQLP
ncbi:hypothetical protein BGZ83_000505 [Gryganskiella cystojenkinii]|nr:hypothetical protein BGZ83_000505 [Gryganskiella cystojenkinii]